MSVAESRQHFDVWSCQWGGGDECLRAAFGQFTTTGAANG
jgi:hypothetical protein